MANTQSNAYKNRRREINKTLTRQGMFIAEYIQSKYKDLYREAAMMYNELNTQYPKKPDLRKTQEFRIWKNKMAKANGESPVPVPREKNYMYKRTTYWDIELDDTETTPAPKDQTPSITNGRTMCLNIPLMDIPTSTHNSFHQSIIEEGDQIPPPSVQPPTEQVIDPSILDGIPHETIEKIIQELRADPNLKDIMEDVEQEITTEIIGPEIELPELDDLLEEELELW